MPLGIAGRSWQWARDVRSSQMARSAVAVRGNRCDSGQAAALNGNPMAKDDGSDVRWIYRRAGGVMSAFIRLVRATSRLRTEPADIGKAFGEPWPFIAGMWHGQFMMLPYVNPDKLPGEIVLARHADAELMGVALEGFGFRLIRGAGGGARGKDRGGAQALRGALKALKSGSMVGMVCEVPPGPARIAAPGIIVMAKLSGKPIQPIAAATSNYLSLNTWSRFTINMPFSRMALVMGDPIHVPRDADEATIEAKRMELQTALEAATSRAYEMCGADPTRATPRRLLPAPQPGLMLKGYRVGTEAARVAASTIFSRRAKRGKEDPAREGERYGAADTPRPDGRLIWVHGASVGETHAALPVIEAIKARFPGLRVLLTTGTVTSAERARARLGADDIHQYVPLDAPTYVRRFLEHWRPDAAVFVESEVWPNLVLEMAERKRPMALINGRISAKSFKSWGRRPHSAHALFGRFDLVAAQDERMALRFQQLGAPDVRVTGNVKNDAPAPAVDRTALAELQAMVAGRPHWLAASTHDSEEFLIAGVHREARMHHEGLLTIIAPRHPERGAAIAELLRANGFSVARRSQGEIVGPETEIYLADTLGELGTLYALNRLAFIGGSLVPHGGQNPIEAVRHDCAVLAGPHTINFRNEYRALEKAGGGLEVASADALAVAVRRMIGDPEIGDRMNEAAHEALAGLTGGLARTVDALEALLGTALRSPDDRAQRSWPERASPLSEASGSRPEDALPPHDAQATSASPAAARPRPSDAASPMVPRPTGTDA